MHLFDVAKTLLATRRAMNNIVVEISFDIIASSKP